ncbi:hypothetical protein NKH18_23875 [Streptomyces sp. M10(2022)]
MDAGPEGIQHEDLTSRVANALALDPFVYTGEDDLPRVWPLLRPGPCGT